MQTDNSIECLPAGFFNPQLGSQGPSIIGGGVSFQNDGPFELYGSRVKHCKLLFGRTLVTCEDKDVPEIESRQGDLYVYAKITHNGNSGVTLDVKAGSELPDNTVSNTFRLLYFIGDGGTVDYRWIPVVVAMS